MSAISIYIYMPVSSRLQQLLQTPTGQWLLFSLYNLPTTAIGAGLFYGEVHYLGQNKFAMYAANFPLVTTMTYCVNRQLPQWKARSKSRTSGLGRWSLFSAAKWGTKYSLFILIVGMMGAPYLMVNFSLAVSFGVLSYLVNDRKIFPRGDEIENGARPGSL